MRLSVYSTLAVTILSATAPAFCAGTTTDSQFLDYAPGTISSQSLQNSGAAAVGLPVATDDGQTTPFTPPFHASSIVIIGAGGHITLHFAQPVISTGQDIGVFTNTGLKVGTSIGGAITAGTGTLGMADTAIVSVSNDDSTWFSLNSGNPLDLTMPSNAFTDTTLSGSGGATASGGTTPANPYQPFTATLSSLYGQTYPQIISDLNGSWGGAWIDASAANFQINFIRFDVPTGDRLVLDAVTAENAVPEPATLALFTCAAGILITRRKAVRR